MPKPKDLNWAVQQVSAGQSIAKVAKQLSKEPTWTISEGSTIAVINAALKKHARKN